MPPAMKSERRPASSMFRMTTLTCSGTSDLCSRRRRADSRREAVSAFHSWESGGLTEAIFSTRALR